MAFTTYVIIPGDNGGNPQPKMSNAFSLVGIPLIQYGTAIPPTPVPPVVELVAIDPTLLVSI